MASAAPDVPAPAPYSATAAYKEHVISMMKKTVSDFPRIIDGEPIVSVLAYHHLGVAVSDLSTAIAFYEKLGFKRPPSADAADASPSIAVLRGAGGLQLHLIRATAPLDGNQNLLMDFPTVKPPGHTHASWSVPSVPAVKALLAGIGVPLSGTRSTLAVFARDPDRTTLEFERNDGGDEPPAVVSAAMIGVGAHGPRPMDHVGIRVRAPLERHVRWYAQTLGFERMVNRYEADPDPLKNMPPWITRTAAGVDVNFIINCNTPAPAADAGGEGAENALLTDGVIRPGILYPGFAIAEGDAAAVLARLQKAGVDAVLDTQLAAGAGWGGFPAEAVRLLDEGGSGSGGARPTVLARDLNGSIVRLVPAAAADVVA